MTEHQLMKETEKLVAEKLATLRVECEKRGSLEEQIDFLLLVLASQATIFDGAMEQLQDEVLAVRMCLPKDAFENAMKVIDRAKAEEDAAR